MNTSPEDRESGSLIARAGRIASVMARHGLKDLVGGISAEDATEQRLRARGFKDALEELGPTFSKLGQILSTRPDLLPPAFIDELSSLQEKVTPLTEAQVVSAIEGALGVPWEDAFESIDPKPLAAGTIAQVHRATLENGDHVAVKVQRPGARGQIEQDLELLTLFAEKTVGRASVNRLIDVPALTRHLSEGLRIELDFTNEAASMERIRDILQPYSHLGVPRVYSAFTSPTLLVDEYIDGVRLRDAPMGAARKEAAKQLLESYFRQILQEGFFHADPHPGNLRWARDRIYFLDFGMVGEIDEETRDTLILLMMALWQEDTEFVAEAMISLSGPSETDRDLEAFTADLDELMKSQRHLKLAEGQLGPLLTQLTTIALRHDVRMPASLALAGKALAQMQLAAGELDPQLDPFSVAGSFFSRLVLSQLRGSVSPGRLLYEASKVRSRLSRMFLSIEGLMSGARDGRLKVQFRGTERLEDTIGRVGRRLVLSLVTTASMVSTAMVATSSRAPGWVAGVDAGIGGVFAFALIWDLLRKR